MWWQLLCVKNGVSGSQGRKKLSCWTVTGEDEGDGKKEKMQSFYECKKLFIWDGHVRGRLATMCVSERVPSTEVAARVFGFD